MTPRKLSILALTFILLSFSVEAALLKGTIYNDVLETESSLILNIREQQIVSHDGSYEIQLDPGSYPVLITKKDEQGQILFTQEEHITLTEEKEYVYDIILFPYHVKEDRVAGVFPTVSLWPFFTIGHLIGLSVIAICFIGISSMLIKKKDVVPDQNSGSIISFIKKQGGRVTQKDIRKAFPTSEARMSLTLTELESRGQITKLKKGRGNIIYLRS